MTKRRPISVRAYWLMISLAFRADALGAILLCVVGPAGFIAPALGAVAAKFVVDAAVDGRIASAVWAGVLGGVVVLATLVSSQLTVYLIHAIGEKVNVLVERRLAELLLRLPGIEHYERADYLNEVQLLRNQAGFIGDGFQVAVQLVSRLVQVAFILTLLAGLTPLLLLLPLFAVPSFVAGTWSRGLIRRAQERTAEPDRLLHRFVGLVVELPAAREARLFGLADDLRARRRSLARTVDEDRGRALLRSTVLGWAGDLIFAAGYLGAIVLVLERALRGELSAGDVALVVVLAGQVQGFITGVVAGMQSMVTVYIVAARLDWLREYEESQRTTGEPTPAPERIARGIRLDGVTFRYPGTDHVVLDDVSLDLPAGAVVALVGDNGAGKSTLVKLLLRFYTATSGRVLVDDVDIAELDPAEWRRRTSGAFQDFCTFEFRAGESIGLGDINRIDDEAAVLTAAELGRASEVLEGLPAGADTQLGAAWPGGIDLSGGQWQRIALARARMREHPLLLVLDEPTAALDARVEHDLFRGFAAAARDAGRRGGITLFVTHRFSTVRMADLILVLDGGRIREAGDHDALMRLGGLYAELFELQADAYR